MIHITRDINSQHVSLNSRCNYINNNYYLTINIINVF